MPLRKIIEINEEKCNGCGQCIPNCVEGALAIVDGKAKLVKDIYCDGLGACLGHCPEDALKVIERDAAEFDQAAAMEYVKVKEKPIVKAGGCPGSMARKINSTDKNGKNISRLKQWPVQLMLVPVKAEYFKQADLLITADCVPFAYPNYHEDFLKDKAVVVGCPKLDNANLYADKLSEIIKENDLESITILRMQVPCCGGLSALTKTARDKAAVDIPIKVITISFEGEVIKREYI